MATGVALVERGVSSIQVLEQAHALRRVGAAIGLYPNGLAALEYISPQVREQIQSKSSPCQVFERRDLQDKLIQKTDVPDIGATAPVMYAWFLLQQHFADSLPDNCLQLAHTLESYRILESGLVQVSCKRDNSIITKTCRLLIGTDGINSRVRRQLLGGQPNVEYYGKVMYRAVLDKQEVDTILDVPNGAQISWQGNEKGKSFSLRETTKGVITITAAAVQDYTAGSESRDRRKKDRLLGLFKEFPSPVKQIIDRLPNSIHEDFIRDVNIPEHWSGDGPVVILGDAAHAMTPHMGQGANMGLEDVCELVHRVIAADDITAALADFCECRLPRVKEVQDRSRENTLQSNTFDKQSASIPFERRKYSETFKDRLYKWMPPTDNDDPPCAIKKKQQMNR
eukprot:CAMPEP_0113530894 /NCGR_PEP_ID=MMETSP0015_2-20120614/3199_1 /TAXON_ID=2838 /ORGANISM="Odontella" /LENGTH=395 /DNA_ID=CAMNT_0000429679 /DNA_START=325 /DNA_END=1513 /DNA_ORIENTATION=+ /assembly_acc=CAM_ASM_000160